LPGRSPTGGKWAGSGFQLAMPRAHSRAFALSVTREQPRQLDGDVLSVPALPAPSPLLHHLGIRFSDFGDQPPLTRSHPDSDSTDARRRSDRRLRIRIARFAEALPPPPPLATFVGPGGIDWRSHAIPTEYAKGSVRRCALAIAGKFGLEEGTEQRVRAGGQAAEMAADQIAACRLPVPLEARPRHCRTNRPGRGEIKQEGGIEDDGARGTSA
jgi:hypothetical protein